MKLKIKMRSVEKICIACIGQVFCLKGDWLLNQIDGEATDDGKSFYEPNYSTRVTNKGIRTCKTIKKQMLFSCAQFFELGLKDFILISV